MPVIKAPKDNKCWQGHAHFETLVRRWWEGTSVRPLWKTAGTLLQKLKIEISCDPASLILGINPKELKWESQRDICSPLFIVRVRTQRREEPDCATDREVLLPDPTFPPAGLSLDGPVGRQCPPLPVYIAWVGKTLGSKSECMPRPANGDIPLSTIINKGGGRRPHLNQEGPDPGLLIKCLGKRSPFHQGCQAG